MALNVENLAMAYGVDNPWKRSNSILSSTFHDTLLEGRSIQAAKNVISHMAVNYDHPGRPERPVDTRAFNATPGFDMIPGHDVGSVPNTISGFHAFSSLNTASGSNISTSFCAPSGSNTTSNFGMNYSFNIPSVDDNRDQHSGRIFANVPSGGAGFALQEEVTVPGAFGHGVHAQHIVGQHDGHVLGNNGAVSLMGASGGESGSSSRPPAGSRRKPRAKNPKAKRSNAIPVEYDVSKEEAALQALIAQEEDDEGNNNPTVPTMDKGKGKAGGKLVESNDISRLTQL